MFSSILSSSKSWIVWMVLGLICLGVIVFIYLAKKHAKKSNDQQEKAWAENVRRNQILQKQMEEEHQTNLLRQEEQKKINYKEQLDNKLESIFNYKADNIVKLWRSKKCTNAVANYLESEMGNHMCDLDYYVMPKKYFIDFNVGDCNDSMVNKYTEIVDFLSKKIIKLVKEIDAIDYAYSELQMKLDFYNYLFYVLSHHIEGGVNYSNFVRELGDYDLRNSSNGIESINALYLGLNGLGIIKNFTLEDFYTFVALKQHEMNCDKLSVFCNKYNINDEKIGNDICDFIIQLNDMDEDCLNNYFISHPNNVLFDIIKCVTDKNGGDDLAELLILIISHNSPLNYRESIDVSRAILDIYDNTEKAKVKAANYINGIDKCKDSVSIYDVDVMSGVEFEEFVGKIFVKLGYTTEITKASGDQGVDLIAKKDGKVLAIQAKCYSGVVGNHAIMEVVAGMKYYDCNCCMVVTNSTFTPAAKELAKANNVEIWDRNELKEQMELLGAR